MFKVFLVSTAIFLILAIFGVPLFYLFIAFPVKVVGESMSPSAKNGEYIMLDKFSYRMDTPKLGDIVLFKDPSNANKELIERIIGLPKQKISFYSGQVYVNDSPIAEKYLKEDEFTKEDLYPIPGGEVIVPADSYYVLNDSRNDNTDSRHFGFIKKTDILGKLWFKIY